MSLHTMRMMLNRRPTGGGGDDGVAGTLNLNDITHSDTQQGHVEFRLKFGADGVLYFNDVAQAGQYLQDGGVGKFWEVKMIAWLGTFDSGPDFETWMPLDQDVTWMCESSSGWKQTFAYAQVREIANPTNSKQVVVNIQIQAY